MTAAEHDLAADALDQQIERARVDGYFEEAIQLASDSLALRITAVKHEPSRFGGLSSTLDLTAHVIYDSDLPAPAIFESAVELYYEASTSCVPAEHRLGHANFIVEKAEELVRMRRPVEAIAACKAAESVFADHMSGDGLAATLPGRVRAKSVICFAFYLQDDKEAVRKSSEERDDLLRQCAELGLDAPEDILVPLLRQVRTKSS